MRILRVIASMDPAQGGPCQGIRNSIPALGKLGVYNEVVCLDSPKSNYLHKDPFTIHAIGPGKTAWCYTPDLIPWLQTNLNRFDAVIVHGLWQYHSYAVTKVIQDLKQQQASSSEKRIPKVFVMPHGMLDPYFQKAKERRLKAIRNWFYWKIIENKVISSADGVLFTCEAELELAQQPFRPYKPKQTINIGYGIAEPPVYTSDMQDAFTAKIPQLEGRPYFLYLGRVHEKKGVDMLIKAYGRILESRSKYVLADASEAEEDFFSAEQVPQLVIAGPGLDTAYGEYLQQLVAASSELKNSIHFTGMLTGNAKWGAFHGCEAFILPSHQENFGISVVEALACAKAVLISNQVNIWREIETEQGGIVAANTEEGTQQMLSEWLDLIPQHKRAMGECARHIFEQYFAIGPHAKRLLEALS
ncbi:glycosyltransferase [Pontibacter sp. H249]|uniref:glycosyltransferase n=1 Tax=Pontibacter sp. H249 TaxID=3133420 RepID=UPI0030C05B45